MGAGFWPRARYAAARRFPASAAQSRSGAAEPEDHHRPGRRLRHGCERRRDDDVIHAQGVVGGLAIAQPDVEVGPAQGQHVALPKAQADTDPLITTRFSAAFPSRTCAPVVLGATKSRASTSVKAPVFSAPPPSR